MSREKLGRAAFEAYKSERNSVHKGVIDYDWGMVPIRLKEVWCAVSDAIVAELSLPKTTINAVNMEAAPDGKFYPVSEYTPIPEVQVKSVRPPDAKLVWFNKADHIRASGEIASLLSLGYEPVLGSESGSAGLGSWILMVRK